MVVRRQIDYAEDRGVPWGISESAHILMDRHGNYQYKAFGIPSLGLKRGLGDELVVAPYATALAAGIEPAEAARNFRRLIREGLEGAYGYYEAIDYSHDKAEETERPGRNPASLRGTVVRSFMAHHQGMTLVALANVLLDNPMEKRFHADPRVQATELLLQERVPRMVPITQPRPVEETRLAGPPPSPAIRRFRSPHTGFPHAQFLSNGNYTAVITNGGGGASFCRGRAVTRHREDPTRDPGSQFLYLRDVRSGSVWSATFRPTAKEPEEYLVSFLAERATFRRRDDGIATQLDIAVSNEDDVEVRRLGVTNHSDRPREIEITSYAEIVLAPPADDLAHPAFGKLFVETEYLRESAALLCHRRTRAPDEPGAWAIHVLSLEGRKQGPVEWESDRGRFLGRGGSITAPAALDLDALRGQPVVLSFWVTWCGHCRAQTPLLVDAHARESATGVQFVGVNVRETADLVQPYVDQQGILYPVVLDADGRTAQQYQISGYPTTYFLDAEGRVVARHVGQLNAQALEQYLALLL